MRKIVLCLMALAAIAAPLCAKAQQSGHPKVLQVTREYLKPYRGGALHDKTEGAFAAAMSAAHWPTHYLGLNSLSGKSRAVYFITYDSFEAWEKDTAATMKNATLSAALERAAHADGELLDSLEQTVFTFDEELSYRPSEDIGHMRFVEVTIFHVHPGHGKDFVELAKLVMEAHKKAGTSAHWSVWDKAYGGDADEYLLLSGDKNMADIDKGFAENDAFIAALGNDGKKKFRELIQTTIASVETELLAINPRQSYAKEEWIQADSEFWKPKPAPTAPVAKKPAP